MDGSIPPILCLGGDSDLSAQPQGGSLGASEGGSPPHHLIPEAAAPCREREGGPRRRAAEELVQEDWDQGPIE